jgi:hypothetical protein
MADRDLTDGIRLIEIVEVPERPGGRNSGPHLKVTMGFFDGTEHLVLQSTWYFRRKDWPDDSILPVAKNWFHGLCKALGDATQKWDIPKDQLEAMKRAQPSTPPS